MILKTCEREDLETCARLLAEVYSEPPYNETWQPADAWAYLDRFRTIEPDGCFVACVNNGLLGAVFSFSYPWQADRLVCIQELFVHPEQRKKGIARQLLAALSGGKRVNAWLVAHERSGAAEFYKKMGFSQESAYRFNYGQIGAD